MKEVWSSDEEALGQLQLPECVVGAFGDYGLHPSLMDGALQCVVALSDDGLTQGQVILPFAFQQLDIFAPLTQQCFVYVVKEDVSMAASKAMDKFTVNVIDDEGEILVRLKGFCVRVVKELIAQDSEVVKNTRDEVLYFEPMFENEALPMC